MNNLIQQPQGRGNASSSEVLNGKTFTNDNGEQTGTMANNGAVSGSVGVGGSYTIPAGYHNGSGKVAGPTLDGNASAANVLSGATFYSNSGTKQTGTLPYIGQYYESDSYGSGDWGTDDPFFAINKIAEGVYAAEGEPAWAPEARIRCSKLGNVRAHQVLSGCSFTSIDAVAGWGTMPNNGAWGTTISPGGAVTIPAGYHNGGGVVSASAISPSIQRIVTQNGNPAAEAELTCNCKVLAVVGYGIAWVMGGLHSIFMSTMEVAMNMFIKLEIVGIELVMQIRALIGVIGPIQTPMRTLYRLKCRSMTITRIAA